MFNDVIREESELRTLLGHPSDLALRKESARLTPAARDFIARSPFVLVATAGADGRCDVSPKGDAPGFVLVLDDTHLAIPDRPGNRRFDGMRSILQNPHVGLIFLVPGKEETLRVNGRACIVRDDALLARMEARGKRPALALGVEVEECFVHCAKAFKRSGLWDASTWPSASTLPPLACMIPEEARAGISVEEIQRRVEEGYVTRLY